MKRLTYLIAVVAAWLAASCTHELETTMPDGKLSFRSISASMADLPTSKAQLKNGGKVVWDQWDDVGVFSDTQTTPVQFTCTSVNESKAVFSSDGEISGSKFFAYYPYWTSGINGDTMIYTLTCSTQYATNYYPIYSPMIAKSETNEFSFKHTCGIIRFSITGTKQITSLILQGNNNEVIAGTGMIDLSAETPVFVIPTDAPDAGKDVSITMPGNGLQLSSTATDFYFIVPPGEFSKGLTLTIIYINKDGSYSYMVIATSKNITVSRSVMKSFTVFDTDEFIQEQKKEDEKIYNALMAFYNATGGDNWTNNTNWGSDKQFYEWYGVIYNNNIMGEKEILLSLENNNLVGNIPEDILSNLEELTSLYVTGNRLSSIYLSGNKKLYQLWCGNNEIKTLQVRHTSVQEILCSNNLITKIDINSNIQLSNLQCNENPITELRIDSLVNLQRLTCDNCLLSSLNIENNKELTDLSCSDNKLVSLDVSAATKLQSLGCSDNALKSLDVSKNKNLEELSCFRCNLDVLNVTGLSKLKGLVCGENNLKNIDVSTNLELKDFWCSINYLSSIDISKNLKLSSFICGNAIDGDGSIVEGNNCITELDVRNNPELSVLFCSANKLISLDLSNNKKLIQLDCNSNNISTIDLSSNKSLMNLYCANNGISSLDVTNNDSLKHIECSRNNLTKLDVTKNLLLEGLYCSYNNLAELDVSNNSVLSFLSCLNNSNLTKIYVKSGQQFQYAKDETAEFVYVGGGEGPVTPEYYTSTDYSSDGKVSTLQTATLGKGINLVLMGDGYSDRLIAEGTYEKTMKLAMEKFFAVEPYKSYREYFNVYTVTAVSANEVYETGSATVFSCYFGGGTHVGGDDAKVFTYAQKAISEDKIDDAVIIVMMNSTQYAGTCWLYFPASGDGDYGSGASISYFPVGEDETMLKQVLQHEACGHGFAKLGDEYQDMFMEEIPESMITLAREQEKYGWLKNIDFTSDSTKVKWNKFLFDARYANEGLGVYEGANTYSKGVYRSSWSSIMRDHKGGFNAPSREAIYYRLHKLAYGTEWQYDYEKFVQYDSINLTPASKSIILRSTTGEQRPPLPAPVVIRSSWRNAKSNVPSKSAAGGVNHGLLRGNARQVSPASAAFASPILTRRVPLPDGRTAITTIDASGKTKVTYENKESK